MKQQRFPGNRLFSIVHVTWLESLTDQPLPTWTTPCLGQMCGVAAGREWDFFRSFLRSVRERQQFMESVWQLPRQADRNCRRTCVPRNFKHWSHVLQMQPRKKPNEWKASWLCLSSEFNRASSNISCSVLWEKNLQLLNGLVTLHVFSLMLMKQHLHYLYLWMNWMCVFTYCCNQASMCFSVLFLTQEPYNSVM